MQIKSRNSFSLNRLIKMSKIIIVKTAEDAMSAAPAHTINVLMHILFLESDLKFSIKYFKILLH